MARSQSTQCGSAVTLDQYQYPQYTHKQIMLTHQVAVGVVGIFLRHGQVHSQGDTVGKDGQQDYYFKRSEKDL